jgi:hypothetical protein
MNTAVRAAMIVHLIRFSRMYLGAYYGLPAVCEHPSSLR